MSNLAALNENTDISEVTMPENPDLWFVQKFEDSMRKRQEAHIPSMALVVTRATLDWA